jgi:hypothetical protein
VRILALLALFASAADHWTTYLCLRQPVDGWLVIEANPIADWLFGTIGLVPGLLLDSVLTLAAILFLLGTRALPERIKGAFLGLVILWTAYAVVNNLEAVATLGLSPFGGPAA